MYKDTEFLYAVTRIRAIEEKISTKNINEKMITAESFDEAVKIYCEAVGSRFHNDSGISDYESILDDELCEVYSFVSEISPDKTLTDIFKYPYDCQNIKSAIKCEMLGIPKDGLMFSFGTVDIEGLTESVRSRDFTLYPRLIAEAALDALDISSKAEDAQMIDILLDKACLEACYIKSMDRSDFLRQLMTVKIDLYNFSVILRCMAMKKSFNFVERVIIPRGIFDKDFFGKRYDISSCEKFISSLRYTDYSEISDKMSVDMTLSKKQKVLDEFYLSLLEKTRLISFGPEPLCAYIVMRENEIKNSRIILSAKKASLSETEIRERIRILENY